LTDKFALPKQGSASNVYVGQTEYDGCTPLNGRISELLVYSRALSPEEVSDVEGYLMQKWACCTE
jgi:hypothetical protein